MEKFFLLSKTVQGVLIAALPTVCQLLGWDWTPADADSINSVFELGAQLGGALWALIGRFTAKAAVKVF